MTFPPTTIYGPEISCCSTFGECLGWLKLLTPVDFVRKIKLFENLQKLFVYLLQSKP